jgi:hypothetical protein
MEATLILECGSWKNFDEIEDYLTLDELILLHDAIVKREKHNFRLQAALQGADIGDDEDGYEGDDDLPEEILQMERERKKRLEELEDDPTAEFEDLGFGKDGIGGLGVTVVKASD